MFTNYEVNRDVDEARATRIGEQMVMTGGNMQPIIISATGKIVDGQHRGRGCDIFNLPLAYILTNITDEEAIEIITNMNKNQRSWNGLEFMYMNAKLQIPGYEFYLSLMNKKSDFSLIKDLARLTNKIIEDKEPAEMVPMPKEKLELVRYLAKEHAAAFSEAPRQREFMRAINLLEDALSVRRQTDKTIPTRVPLARIKKNFIKTLGDFGVLDRPVMITRKMSEAIDRARKVSDRIELYK